MPNLVEVKVPDIGDFKNVPVIEILVKPGDTVRAEDALITLESDKATLDVPSPMAGVVGEIKIKVGDAVSQGASILILDAQEGAGVQTIAPAAPPPPLPATPVAGPIAGRYTGGADVECEMLVLGAGPGG